MPVVSPSRYSTSSASTLNSLSSGTYRSPLNSSSSLDKPYYRGSSGTYVSSTIRSSYGDRTTEYRSRFIDLDGKRERKTSITEYSRNSRAPSVTESDSGISSRYLTRGERGDSRSRDLSLTRSDKGANSDPLPRNPAGTLARRNVASTALLASSAADLYNKYSPANYIPLSQRLSTSTANQNNYNNSEISRSKSISNDIGRPPAADSRSSRKARNSVAVPTVAEHRSAVGKHARSSSTQAYKEHSPSPSSSYARKQSNGTKDPNGNDVQQSVAEIRKRFDPKMAVTKLPTNDTRYARTSMENYMSQLKNCQNGTTSYTKILPKDDKPVPVHLPSLEKAGKWEVSTSRSNSNSDISISKATSEPLSLAKPVEKTEMSTSLTAKLPSERVPLAIKSQLDPNNPIGKILEKSTVIQVESADKYKKYPLDNITSIEVGKEKMSNGISAKEKMTNGVAAKEKMTNGVSVKEKMTNGTAKDANVTPKHTSNFASYIQISRPIVSGAHSRSESPKRNGDSDESPKLKYIDDDNRLILDNDIDSPTALNSGFENKTFEHENYLMKRGVDDEFKSRLESLHVSEDEDSGKKMETSTESTTSDLTEDSSPETPLARRKVEDDEEKAELAGGRTNRHSEPFVNGTLNGTKTKGLKGLRNIGNTCFMNSVLQCLSNTQPLLEYVSNDRMQADINTTLSCMKGALIKAFATVIKELWREGDSDVAVNTIALKSQVQRFAPRFMGYSQQDAQEFLRYLLEGLHEDVNRVTVKPKPILTEIEDSLSDAAKAAESWQRYLRMEESRVGDIFMGQLKSTLRCTHCQRDSVTFDPFWDLSLPIPSRTSNLKIQQCLAHFNREEELDGDEKPTCSRCGVRRKCLKWFTVQRFPRVLVLHLKRFSPTERFRGKLNVLVEFPLNGLDMSPYAANKGQEATYNLYAVSNHSGTTYSGHYTAYCKHPYTGDWYEYNDSRVTPISPRSVVSSEAYVLFYELASPHSS